MSSNSTQKIRNARDNFEQIMHDITQAAEKRGCHQSDKLREWAEVRRLDWVKVRTLSLLEGDVAAVIMELEAFPAGSVPYQVSQYFKRNAGYMHYDAYLRAGWPIASGVIEGACRHLVKDRCEGGGMRWTMEGAEHLLALRSVAINDDWQAYHCARRAMCHGRLYRCPHPERDTPEDEVLRLAA